jgi:hypothetical protein
MFVAVALLGSPLSALAHHGTAVTYDLTKTITLSGTVTEWDFTFPHPAIYFDVKDAKGSVEHWGAETGANPAIYAKNGGITRNSIKAGDKLDLTCHPHRDASARACLVMKAVVNGQEIKGLSQQNYGVEQTPSAPK